MGRQDSNPIFWRSIIGLTCLWFIDFEEKSWVDQQCYRLCYRAVHGSEFMPLHSYVSADVHGATRELRQSPLTWQRFSRNRPATKCAGTAGGYSSDADVIWMVQIGLQLIFIYIYDWLIIFFFSKFKDFIFSYKNKYRAPHFNHWRTI